MPSLSEKEIIYTTFAPLSQGTTTDLGLTDDAALWTPSPDQDYVITKDSLVAGVHFFADDPPQTIGWKSLAVNLSDLAAKGAAPEFYLLAIALPDELPTDWIREFAAGLNTLQEEAKCFLIGGDTVYTPGPLTISITAFGNIPKGGFVARRGAKAGDQIYVSGTIGDAALGLDLRKSELARESYTSDKHKIFLIDRYLRPEPRIRLAEPVRQFATAAMDVSDGLAGDLSTICELSDCGATLYVEQLPFSAATRAMLDQSPQLLGQVLSGGDDYEILLTVQPDLAMEFEQAAQAINTSVTCIGEINGETGVTILNRGQPVELDTDRYSHF
ncbi:MAG: thiamine-phosphate kinase [Methyloligellaceae bacterium]